MPDKIRRTALAAADLASLAHHYLNEAGLEVALRFVDNAERSFGQLAAMPDIGALVGFSQSAYSDIRRWHVDGFPRIVVFYRPIEGRVDIVRVLDGARDLEAIFNDS